MLHVLPPHCTDFDLSAALTEAHIQHNGPRLHLIQQTSSMVEKVSKNGIQKNVHVVVKNMPFVIQIGLSSKLQHGNLTYDLKNLALDLQLLYDNDALKPVGFVRTRPCDFKTSVSERGDTVTITTRIKVLTSQHEDMFFLVRIRGLDPKGRKEFNPPLDLLSYPIKVISKPKQLKKRKTQRKRSLNDLLTEAVARIEERQNAQREALERILLGGGAAGGSSDFNIVDPNEAPKKRPRQMSLIQQVSSPSVSLVDDDEDGEESEGGEARSGEVLVVSPPVSFDMNTLQFMSPGPTALWPPGMAPGIDPSAGHLHPDLSLHSSPMMPPPYGLPPTPQQQQQQQQPSPTPPTQQQRDPFTMAMAQFLLSYQNLPVEDRPTTIRRVIRDCSIRETEQLSDLFQVILQLLSRRFTWQTLRKKKEEMVSQPVDLGLVKTEPTDKDKEKIEEEGGSVQRHERLNFFPVDAVADPAYLIGGEEIVCNCPNCPHKKELETIDQFYREFITSEIPLESIVDSSLC